VPLGPHKNPHIDCIEAQQPSSNRRSVSPTRPHRTPTIKLLILRELQPYDEAGPGMPAFRVDELRGDAVVLHFGGVPGTIDARTLGEALLGFAELAYAVSGTVDPGQEVEIVFEALGLGSFRTVIQRIRKTEVIIKVGKDIDGATDPMAGSGPGISTSRRLNWEPRSHF
jgi:hypothetical protein